LNEEGQQKREFQLDFFLLLNTKSDINKAKKIHFFILAVSPTCIDVARPSTTTQFSGKSLF